MSSWVWKAGLAGLAIAAATAYAVAQAPSEHAGAHGPMHGRMMESMQGGMHGSMHGGAHAGQHAGEGMHGSAGHHGGHHGAAGTQPTRAGQEAFGTIQEIVQLLEADPGTDWSKVDIGALRQHLIDMDEVTMHADAAERPLADGIEIAVAGEGRTLEAIRRMVPAHVAELAKLGWAVETEGLPDGVKLTVTSSDADQVAKLQALGFMGIMVQGGHHQPHHLMMAKGELQVH